MGGWEDDDDKLGREMGAWADEASRASGSFAFDAIRRWRSAGLFQPEKVRAAGTAAGANSSSGTFAAVGDGEFCIVECCVVALPLKLNSTKDVSVLIGFFIGFLIGSCPRERSFAL